MTARRRVATIIGTMALISATLVLPVSATGVEAPTTEFSDEFGAGMDLTPYIYDRFSPSATPPYTPTLTLGTDDGRDVGVFGVDGDGPTSGFYAYQGFKRTTDGTNAGVYGNGFGTCLETTFKLDPDFATSDRIVSFWPVTDTEVGGDMRWPIAGITGYADAGEPDTLSFWVYPGTTVKPGGWNHVPLPPGFDYDAWHTFTYVLTPNGNTWYLDGEFVWTDPSSYQSDQVRIDHQIFNFRNYGEDYATSVDSFRVGGCTELAVETLHPEESAAWTPAASNTATGGYSDRYGGALGDGAWMLDTGDGDGAGLGGKSWLFTDDLTGLRLAELTELRYSTYVDSSSGASDHLAPALNLQVDWDADGTRDSTLVWEPVYVASTQGPVVFDTWQEWDALDDGWWYTSSFGTLTSPAGSYEPIGEYLIEYPDATIVNWGGHTPGFAFVSGQSSGGIWADFVGAVDAFAYGVANGDLTTIDFEATSVAPADASADATAVGADTGANVTVSLAARNGAIQIPALTSYTGIDVRFDWELTDGGSVLDSGTATVPGGEPSVDVAVTVPGTSLGTPGSFDFAFTISNPVEATIGDPDSTVTIAVPAPPITGPTVHRIGGANRYETAALVAEERFPTADVVFVATGEIHPDALVAAAPAGDMDAPVLLVTRDSVPAATRSAIEGFAPTTIYVVGGPAAISPAVEAELASLGAVERLAGSNRYGTSVAVSRQFHPAGVDHLIVATGISHPDALVAAAPAGRDGVPILLVPGTSVPGDVEAEIARLAPTTIYLVGGEAAVSAAVEATLAAYAPVERLAGSNRYLTAEALVEEFYPDADAVASTYLATAELFPDALVAAAPAAMEGAPILITAKDSLASSADRQIRRLQPADVYVVGGPAAISDSVLAQIDW